VQGEALSWLGSCTAVAAASLLRFPPQQPCSMPLPAGDTTRTQAAGAERGERKIVLLVLFFSWQNIGV